MHIRLPFAGVFFLLCLLAGYVGLSSLQLNYYINDKVLHLLTFFLLTVVFYWIVDTNRRRTLHFTLVVCTAILGVGSEFLQGFLPNGRVFDLYDIVANVVGSLAGLALCNWYHKRMLERKRSRRGVGNYNAVPGEDIEDVELGESSVLTADHDGQEEGIMSATAADPVDVSGRAATGKTLEEEVDTWDENAVDNWDEEDDGDIGTIPKPKGKEAEQTNGVDGVDTKKRLD
ncbi:VanZ-like protein [Apiospora arundinis]|uniref:VanZ like family protein n=1 Tax=Apiospora arundinis TaxID=335852 RepID=A0ABR2JBN5_9PEZI